MKSVVLCILDGWGNGRLDDPYNAIVAAKTPNWDRILATCANSTLATSGLDVGLPVGQMGNSEVGHMNIGGGRIIQQDLQRIDEGISEVAQIPVVRDMIARLSGSNNVCHIIGLVSDGGVHSHRRHAEKLIKILTKHNVKVKVHFIADGRDTVPNEARKMLKVLDVCDSEIATISGRFYAMDRDKRFDRTKLAYEAIVHGYGQKFADADAYLDWSYSRGVTDEFIVPAVYEGYLGMSSGDAVIFTNFRADRMIQLAEMFAKRELNLPELSSLIGMVQYSVELDIPCIFEQLKISATLGEVLSNNNLLQARITETEKSAHLTYFFNCGREEPFNGEERFIVSSPKVRTYDLQPEMSAYEITDIIVAQIENAKYSFIAVNYANADMVGHTGIFDATRSAIEAIDVCLGRIIEIVSKYSEVTLLITADHGNAEYMFDYENNSPCKTHTINTVPIAMYNHHGNLLNGRLCDIAPTILHILGVEIPREMTGNSILVER